MRRLALLAFLATSMSTLAGEELPQQDEGSSLEIEPPLLIKNRAADGSPELSIPSGALDMSKLEAAVARAAKAAASAERLYRAGIIAKVEAEQRELRVVLLRADLAQARLEEAKLRVSGVGAQASGVDSNDDHVAQTELRRATEIAQAAAAERSQAELAAAIKNLERQQKLLALGSGRKSEVARAEEKLAELKRKEN